MAPEEICKLLQSQFGEAIVETVVEGAHPYAVVSAERWPDVAKFLRDDKRTAMKFLRSITSLDLPEDNKLACVYDLNHVPMESPTDLITETREFAVRVLTDRDNAVLPSVAHLWPTANWHEREAFDLMGIRFEGHPDLTRILLPHDWQGHPLRKDYEYPLEYHGIPATTEHEWTNPRH